jgi:hypothetical protein
VAPAESRFPYQRWVDEAKVPTPDVTLTVVESNEPCNGRRACTIPEEGMIWLGPEYGALETHRDFLHELGHNFDDDVMTPGARARFRALSRHPSIPWAEPGLAELFAETYRQCALTTPAGTPIAGLRWRAAKLPPVG